MNGCQDPPGGMFACGAGYCMLGFGYCQLSVSDIGGEPDSYSCVALPEACGEVPDCECLSEEPCFDFGCEATTDGGLLITCPGG